MVRIRISIVVTATVRMILSHSCQRLFVMNPLMKQPAIFKRSKSRIPRNSSFHGIISNAIRDTMAINDHCTLSFLRKFHMTKRIQGKGIDTESPSSKYSYKILKFNGIISCGESLRAQYYACGWFSQTVAHRLTMVKPFGF